MRIAALLFVLAFAFLQPVLAQLRLDVRVRNTHHLHHELGWQRLKDN